MSKNEIFASLEIADHEIRLVVGEFVDTRFYVLHTEKISHEGISNNIIINEANIVTAIKEGLQMAYEKLGFRIKRVLLAIPSIDVERLHKKINVYLDSASKRVKFSDIQKGINQAIKFRPDEESELINIGCVKYITNGITSRKMPIDEVAESFALDIDLIYGKKEIVYAYAMCVEKAGLELLDICLDSYANAQEAAVFEQTVDKFVVIVNLARQNTTLSLLSHGRLITCDVLDSGYDLWLKDLEKQFQLSTNICLRLVQNTCDIMRKDNEDQVIYVYEIDKQQRLVYKKDVVKAVLPRMNEWFNTINTSCAPIVQNGEVEYLLCGEGCSIPELETMLKQLNTDATIYTPQTIGARECGFITCLGLFYSWKEKCLIQKNDLISCDDEEVELVTRVGKKKYQNEDSGFTKKLKNILINTK